MTEKTDKIASAGKAGLPEWGYSLNFTPNNPAALHDFCGTHNIRGAQCPYCARPLLRILSLSTRDTKLELDPAKLNAVHLLYCWTCSIPYGEFSYRLLNDGGIEILQIPPIHRYAFGADGPYEGYTGLFPLQRVALEPLPKEDQEQLRDAAVKHAEPKGNLATPQHQVGGYPFIFNPSLVSCPSCSREIPLLAAICDDASGNAVEEAHAQDTFTGNYSTQMIFHYCRDCAVVVAYHSND